MNLRVGNSAVARIDKLLCKKEDKPFALMKEGCGLCVCAMREHDFESNGRTDA